MMKTNFKTYSYIHNFAMHFMEIRKITTYNTQHTKTQNIHFDFFVFQKSIFPKTRRSKFSVFYVEFYGTINI